MHVHMCRKDDILRQRRLTIVEWGGTANKGVCPARANTTLVVLVFHFVSGLSVAPFSHRSSAPNKRLILRKLFREPRPHRPFWGPMVAILDIAVGAAL